MLNSCNCIPRNLTIQWKTTAWKPPCKVLVKQLHMCWYNSVSITSEIKQSELYHVHGRCCGCVSSQYHSHSGCDWLQNEHIHVICIEYLEGTMFWSQNLCHRKRGEYCLLLSDSIGIADIFGNSASSRAADQHLWDWFNYVQCTTSLIWTLLGLFQVSTSWRCPDFRG